MRLGLLAMKKGDGEPRTRSNNQKQGAGEVGSNHQSRNLPGIKQIACRRGSSVTKNLDQESVPGGQTGVRVGKPER
jgi:hypothetical protein